QNVTNYRFKTIDVTVGGNCAAGAACGTRTRAYALIYVQGPSSGRSLLATVQQFGRDAILDASGSVSNATTASKLPPIKLSYSHEAFTFTDAGILNSNDATTGMPCSTNDLLGTADFNGDGKADLWCLHNGGINLAVSTPSGTLAPWPRYAPITWYMKRLHLG